ncbi:MAG TPA: PAS domain S-box protein, partial [Thermodesulfobacteriota bacterium]|nr:PAS domain S-box protein [Thermodesulfobacteriota bacterium]
MARKLSYEALLKKITALESELKACKERERALKSGELQYKKIFVSATDGFIILDLNGNVVEANPQACRMHGYSHAEFIKLTGNDFIHPDCHPLFDQFRKETKTRGKFHTEALDVRKDGTSFIVDVKGVQFDYQGKKHLLAIQRDITERKQIEECLRKSSRELRTLSLKLLTVQETEKKRLARELHDGFGQTLTAIRFEVANAVDEIRAHNSTAALPLLEEVVHILKHAVEEVRKVSMDLRPTVLDNAGIVATISWLCREFMKVQPHVRVRQKVTVNEQEISRPLKNTMYR